MNKEQRFRILGLANKIKNNSFTPEEIDNPSRELIKNILIFLQNENYLKIIDENKDLDDFLDKFENIMG